MSDATVTALDEPERIAVGFARVLRGAGLRVPVGNVVTFARALALVGAAGRNGVYWSGRATLVNRPEDAGLYDRAFDAFFLGRLEVKLPIPTQDPDSSEDTLVPEGDGEGPDGPVRTVRYSAVEVLRHKDFASYSAGELAEARRLMADLRLAGALRRSRRLRPSSRRESRLDLRRTVRRALASSGEPMRRSWLDRTRRPRRVVLLLDVSGSMDPYARAFVRFLQAAVAGRAQVEAFALGTRLTRVTRELSSHDPDAAVASASNAVADWSGGTRLGEGLREFNATWGVRGMARGAVVVILSDGWDRGEPQVLAEQMVRLSRVAHRVVWVNPLKAAPGYAPLARGMAAALPYVDSFVEGHSLASLEKLIEVISE